MCAESEEKKKKRGCRSNKVVFVDAFKTRAYTKSR